MKKKNRISLGPPVLKKIRTTSPDSPKVARLPSVSPTNIFPGWLLKRNDFLKILDNRSQYSLEELGYKQNRSIQELEYMAKYIKKIDFFKMLGERMRKEV